MATKTLDYLGQVCPLPAILVRKEIKKMNPGDVFVVKVDCPPAIEAIPEIAQSSGIDAKVVKVGSGNWEITLTKE
ncbi:MAG: sulfurtransferase TusA family protein [Methanoregulaceae archaeon]|nr:sulfurtransferase TusA family protein [Methanoregulaceae archaeon]